jgi:hypothetical protein
VRGATARQQFDVSTDAWPSYVPEIDVQLADRANHSIVVKVYDKHEERHESVTAPATSLRLKNQSAAVIQI